MKKTIISFILIAFLYFMILSMAYGETGDYSIHAQLFSDYIYHLCDHAEPGEWQSLPLFRHGHAVERAIIRNDGSILIQINQSSFDPDAIVTDYSIMVDQSLDNAQGEMNRMSSYIIQAVMKASNQPYAASYTQEMIDKAPNRIVLAGVSGVRIFGQRFLIKKYEYTGSFPENAASLKEQSMIVYEPPYYEQIQENRLSLQDLLGAVFPGDTVDDTEAYCTNETVEGVQHFGELHVDGYFISDASDEIRIYAWHKQNENTDEKIVSAFEFFSSSAENRELLERYLSIFTSLPGVPESFLPLLPFVHGDEFTWSSYLEIPTIQYGNWEMNLILSSSRKQPIAEYRYVP